MDSGNYHLITDYDACDPCNSWRILGQRENFHWDAGGKKWIRKIAKMKIVCVKKPKEINRA